MKKKSLISENYHDVDIEKLKKTNLVKVGTRASLPNLDLATTLSSNPGVDNSDAGSTITESSMSEVHVNITNDMDLIYTELKSDLPFSIKRVDDTKIEVLGNGEDDTELNAGMISDLLSDSVLYGYKYVGDSEHNLFINKADKYTIKVHQENDHLVTIEGSAGVVTESYKSRLRESSDSLDISPEIIKKNYEYLKDNLDKVNTSYVDVSLDYSEDTNELSIYLTYDIPFARSYAYDDTLTTYDRLINEITITTGNITSTDNKGNISNYDDIIDEDVTYLLSELSGIVAEINETLEDMDDNKDDYFDTDEAAYDDYQDREYDAWKDSQLEINESLQSKNEGISNQIIDEVDKLIDRHNKIESELQWVNSKLYQLNSELKHDKWWDDRNNRLYPWAKRAYASIDTYTQQKKDYENELKDIESKIIEYSKGVFDYRGVFPNAPYIRELEESPEVDQRLDYIMKLVKVRGGGMVRLVSNPTRSQSYSFMVLPLKSDELNSWYYMTDGKKYVSKEEQGIDAYKNALKFFNDIADKRKKETDPDNFRK